MTVFGVLLLVACGEKRRTGERVDRSIYSSEGAGRVDSGGLFLHHGFENITAVLRGHASLSVSATSAVDLCKRNIFKSASSLFFMCSLHN